ncbi:MAG: LytR C-terminal domain-containing protein [Nocardioides sp.]|uniref:LytR C-terminal domain-containing protein n=1 Tax=Nocardioides sp. TaxID=35761 RepID=UPI0039E39567
MTRLRDQRGVALPSPVVALSVVAVAVAILAFVLTGGHDDKAREITPAAVDHTPSASASSSSAPSASASASAKRTHKAKPVQRAKIYVEVYNNTNIAGLAGSVASKAETIGWNVVGADNWVGTIPATTVYYPPSLKRAAKQLALDLGIKRLHVADGSSMKGDRLTVVLTGAL